MSTPLDQVVPSGVASSPRRAPPRGPQLSIKRFGRTDFERFDQEAARGSQLCVGSQRIGKVEIDCKYLWKKAQWGVLGTDDRPAGIVYMDINFQQPPGYCLEVANVYVTLAEDTGTYALASNHRHRPHAHRLDREYNVQITDNYGPRLINGAKTIHQKTSTTNLTPHLGAMGIDFGGLGHDSTTAKEKSDAWCFRGAVRRPHGQDGLRTMHWELKENSLDRNQIHSQEYCTAFAFEHSGVPVFMRVEIDGTIRGVRGSARNRFARFSSILGGKDNSTLTQMDFLYSGQSRKRLDDVARGLDMAMQWENWKKAGVEMPGSKPAQYHDQGKIESIEEEEPSFEDSLIEQAIEAEDPVLEALARRIHGGRNERIQAVGDAPQRLLSGREPSKSTEPATRARVRRPLRNTAPSSQQPVQRSMNACGTSTPDSERSSTTVVNPDPTLSELQDDKLKEIVRIPAILFLIRFLVVVASFFSGEETAPSKAQQSEPEWAGSRASRVQIKMEPDDAEEGEDQDDLQGEAEREDMDEDYLTSPEPEIDDNVSEEDTLEALTRIAASRKVTQPLLAASSSSRIPMGSRRVVRQPAPVLKAGR
ncbi:hypothetical protein VFPPC_07670 [Pochonia chlamydosporia 170]|uniref:Uncharacterized protein n=1 Tax=Pochonia chlamydosporia 170 TaxID=1380566 RepID=A0A179FKB2_METCM|nr:hypothetical protein VFPPC_07670 [Pochonia chlamydosporia 170]OAQ66056.1 hypothetical protein VFPPC_07670 [Pochonia chlamydosporia 170]